MDEKTFATANPVLHAQMKAANIDWSKWWVLIQAVIQTVLANQPKP